MVCHSFEPLTEKSPKKWPKGFQKLHYKNNVPTASIKMLSVKSIWGYVEFALWPKYG